MLTTIVIFGHFQDQGLVKYLFDRVDFLLFDMRYQLNAEQRGAREPKVVVVEIDEASLEAVGRWPWSRFDIARLVTALKQQGTLQIGFDMVFAEPEKNLLDFIRSDPELKTNITPEFQRELEAVHSLLDFDLQFASTLTDTVILGDLFHRQEEIRTGLLRSDLQEVSSPLKTRLTIPLMTGYSANLPVLSEKALGSGFFTIFPDHDGVIRRAPLLLQFEDTVYGSLALQMAINYFFIESVELTAKPKGNVHILEAIALDSKIIATDAVGQVIIPQIGFIDNFSRLSAADVLSGKVGADVLEDSLVFIGATAYGLGDLKSTVTSGAYPGVYLHAHILQGIIDTFHDVDAFYARSDLEKEISFLMILVLGVLLSYFLPRTSALIQALTTLFLVVALIGLNIYLWRELRLDFSFTASLLVIISVSIMNLIFGFWFETRDRLQLSGMFGQYVPPDHIEEMLKEKGSYGFEGESRYMAVLFCDIRGFTTLSETLQANELKQLLNRFFTPITEVIFNHQGTIDKYVGDMVMAFWGAPRRDEKPAYHSVLSAMEIVAVCEQLAEVFKAEGLPEISVGVGVNCGTMNVGDMGSEFRRSYTVIGDAVNLGSRVEGLTRHYGVNILVTEESLCEEILFRLVDQIRVKGKKEVTKVFEPMVLRSQASAVQQQLVTDFEKALEFYFAGEWQAAIELLQQLKVFDPASGLYDCYLTRIEELQTSPQEDWTGVYNHTEK